MTDPSLPLPIERILVNATPQIAKTVPQVAERFNVKAEIVLFWIKSGALVAIDVSRDRKTLPRWRITPAALQAFEESRASVKPVKASKPRRKKSSDPNYVEYF